MTKAKKIILVVFLAIAIFITIFPPHIIEIRSVNDSSLISERIEYRSLGGQSEFNRYIYEQTRIAYDRLMLHYLIVAGVGSLVFILISNTKEN